MRALVDQGAVVTHQRGAEQAMISCREQVFDAIILDIALPNASGGSRIFNDLHRQCRGVPVVVWSRDPIVIALMRHRAETLLKPALAQDVPAALARAFGRECSTSTR